MNKWRWIVSHAIFSTIGLAAGRLTDRSDTLYAAPGAVVLGLVKISMSSFNRVPNGPREHRVEHVESGTLIEERAVRWAHDRTFDTVE